MRSNDDLSSAATAGKQVRYSVAPERMPVIAEEKMTAAQRQVAAEVAAGPRGEVKGPAMIMNVARTAVPEGPPLPLAPLPVRTLPL